MTDRMYRLLPLASLLLFGLLLLLGGKASGQFSMSGILISCILLPILFGTIFVAVHYAETIAHRIGEPLGTVVLTLAVTTIEVTLIASMMLHDQPNPTLARDTVFSVIMIVCNGLVGLCIVLGGLKHREQDFMVEGTSSYLTVLITLGTMTLILPNYTRTVPGPFYSSAQLVFVVVVTVVLYAIFLFIQTVRHQDYFADAKAPQPRAPAIAATSTAEAPAAAVPATDALSTPATFGWLSLSLAGVILLAEKFSGLLEEGIQHVGAPEATLGIIVALLILAPESVAAIKAAQRDQLQRSLNLSLGSALASIGLTIPAIAVVNLAIHQDLTLGLEPRDVALLALTFLISVVSLGTGRSNILFGSVHLVIFATYLLFAFIP